MVFKDRREAGERLAEALVDCQTSAPVVVALPRGGVDVALPVALRLKAPMTVLLVRKIGLPSQPELAMGAIVDGDAPITVRNDGVITMARVDDARFDAVARRELDEIHRRSQLYFRGREAIAVEGRVAIIVDDGMATGATVRAAVRGLRARKPSRVILAVPVASQEAMSLLTPEVDQIVVLEEMSALGAIGFSYEAFPQLTDSDVLAALEASEKALKAG